MDNTLLTLQENFTEKNQYTHNDNESIYFIELYGPGEKKLTIPCSNQMLAERLSKRFKKN